MNLFRHNFAARLLCDMLRSMQEAFGIPHDIAKLIHSSETERIYTWMIPADAVAGAGTSSEVALASAVPDNVMVRTRSGTSPLMSAT